MPEPGQSLEEVSGAPSPGGATTVPPASAPTEEPAIPPPVFLRTAGKLFVPAAPPPPRAPVPAPKRPMPRRRPSWRWWLRQTVPVGGLLLMAACLYALFVESPLAERLPGLRPGGVGGGGAGSPMMVVIDPGHGGIDSGAVALGLEEKWLTLDVAQRVARTLEKAGVRVRLTRDADRAVSLEERVRIANDIPSSIFVSIHFNDALTAERGGSYHASGVETYYTEHKEAGVLRGEWMWTSLFGGRATGAATGREALARSAREGASLAGAIQGSLVLATAAANRGTKDRALYVTRRVHAPAVLVEGGFISHPTEARRLGEAGYRQTLAEAIAAGIIHYLQTAAGSSGSDRKTVGQPPTGA